MWSADSTWRARPWRRGAIGLGTAVLTRGNQINIPAGTILDFQLADHLVR